MSTAPQETCWTLIRGAARGGRAEREEFTRRYLPAVRTYLAARWRHTPMHAEVDDGVQEVFVACFKQGGALGRVDDTPGRSFRAFLYAVTRNVALHLERTGARRAARSAPEPSSSVQAEETSLSRTYDRAYARALMREAAETMAVRAREKGGEAPRRVKLLELRFEEGSPIHEIARLWDTDPGELHREYAKAAREFRAALREVVGLSERCAPEHLDRECDRLLDALR
jgi:RNA polymerase sigma-70 factor (ECF subfamily)